MLIPRHVGDVVFVINAILWTPDESPAGLNAPSDFAREVRDFTFMFSVQTKKHGRSRA
jgi:hypothetical protein